MSASAAHSVTDHSMSTSDAIAPMSWASQNIFSRVVFGAAVLVSACQPPFNRSPSGASGKTRLMYVWLTCSSLA